jgi:undecaprenyl diphosphate synthase
MSNKLNHLAIIMDGNGRWAQKHGKSRTEGHKQGSKQLRNIAIKASKIGIKVLSVYAFSTENWSRPEKEVSFLMKLPKQFMDMYKGQFKDHDIRVVFSGRRDRFPKEVLSVMMEVEEKSLERNGMILNICFDYGSKDELVNVVKSIASQVKDSKLSLNDISEETVEQYLYTNGLPPVDLMVRTSGEQRISNFLLWQTAYAEMMFVDEYWPEFTENVLDRVINEFDNRTRRFGGITS